MTTSAAAQELCPTGAGDEPGCLVRWARSGGEYAEATRRLESLLVQVPEPDRGPASLALAELALSQGLFEDLLERAATATQYCLFAGDAACELRARRLHVYALSRNDRLEEAIWEAEKADLLAQRSGVPKDRLKSALTLARLRLSGLVDLGRVEHLLAEIEPLTPHADPEDLLYLRSTRAGVLRLLGYPERAAIEYGEVRDLARAQENLVVASSEEFNRIFSLYISGSLQTSASRLADAVGALEALLEDERTPTNDRLRARALLARIDPARRSVHLRECLREAMAVGDHRSTTRCAAELAFAIVEGSAEDDRSAAELIEIARRAVTLSGNPNAELQVTRAELALLWNTAPGETALARSLELLAPEARRRERQATPARRLEFLGFLNEDHYWLAGRIAIEVAEGNLPPQALEQVVALLDEIRHVRRGVGETTEPMQELIDDWWDRAAAVRGTGTRPLSADARAAFARLEAMPERFLEPMARRSELPPRLDFARIRATLKPGQGIAYFHWEHPEGPEGSWVYLLTGDAIGAHPLDRPGPIELALALLNSSVRGARGDAFENALRRLHDKLLAPLLRDHDGLEHLTVIPDAALYAVPVQALKGLSPHLDRIEVYPSLAAWLRRDRTRPDPRQVRVFADPKLPQAGAPAGTPLRTQRLPAAEREAAALAQLLGDRARIDRGEAATESRARAALESSVGLVHFATHAVLNAANPEASAVVLAADQAHDGWLTLAEVETLTIPPKLIVLSACEAAAGRMLTGEGLIGLSAGFLAAGANAVLANLWPVDDAHAAAFVQRLYQRLENGEPLEAALTRAGADLAAAGYPPTAWAGWTVIGDGSIKLNTPTPARHWLLAAGLLLLAAAVLGAWRGRP